MRANWLWHVYGYSPTRHATKIFLNSWNFWNWSTLRCPCLGYDQNYIHLLCNGPVFLNQSFILFPNLIYPYQTLNPLLNLPRRKSHYDLLCSIVFFIFLPSCIHISLLLVLSRSPLLVVLIISFFTLLSCFWCRRWWATLRHHCKPPLLTILDYHTSME